VYNDVMNGIQTAISNVLPRHKRAAKGWLSFNAVCCTHNGETPDTRNRGGMLFTAEGGASYHCFNCGFKTTWRPGLHFGYKMRRLMGWMGMDEGTVQRIVLDAMRELDTEIVQQEQARSEIKFDPRELPAGTTIREWLDGGLDDPDLMDAVEYIKSRGFSIDDHPWHWSHEDGFRRRIILPFTWRGNTVGYTARSIDSNSKMKYINSVDSDYVFNMDAQRRDSKFALAMEGPLDAIAVGGVAVLTNEVSERKAEMIDTLGREIIVVPDRDKSGKKLVDAALEYGWSVAFPEWESGIKDCADSMRRYGKLYTLRTILSTKQDSKLKIQLMRREYGV
jgi:hypothetical protein